MTRNDTSFRMSVLWAPWEYAKQLYLLPFSSTIIYLQIATFLRKLQQNFAQSQYFPIHITKGIVLRFHKMNVRLWLAKNSQILPT
jgi:hypothetical protein